MTNAGKIIVSAWEDETCPLMNAIFFSDDRLRLITPISRPASQGIASAVDVGEILNILDVTQSQRLRVTSLVRLHVASSQKTELKCECGEGGFGGDGYIAVMRQGGDLMWLLFTDFSNPFIYVEFDGAYVRAKNSYGLTWVIEICDPKHVEITAVTTRP